MLFFNPPPLAPRDPRFVRLPTELCQLAGVWSGKMPAGEWQAEEKIDGVRAIWMDGQLWSREGAPLDLPHLVGELGELERRLGGAMVIDCEYQEPGGFLDTLTVLGSQGRREPCGKLHVFDAVQRQQWRDDNCSETLAERQARIMDAYRDWQPEYVARVKPIAVRSVAAVDMLARAIWRNGGEGLVLKRRDSLYRRRRSSDWQKLKREITLAGEIRSITADNKAASVQIGERVVSLPLTKQQAVQLREGSPVIVRAMEWTGRGRLRDGRIAALLM
jgi:DNA ligase-1